nr:hypothetical protein GCM10020092_079770 [Actinoplanes digitatis]
MTPSKRRNIRSPSHCGDRSKVRTYAPVGLTSRGTFGGLSGEISSGMLRNIGWSMKSDCQVCGTLAVGQDEASKLAA